MGPTRQGEMVREETALVVRETEVCLLGRGAAGLGFAVKARVCPGWAGWGRVARTEAGWVMVGLAEKARAEAEAGPVLGWEERVTEELGLRVEKAMEVAGLGGLSSEGEGGAALGGSGPGGEGEGGVGLGGDGTGGEGDGGLGDGGLGGEGEGGGGSSVGLGGEGVGGAGLGGGGPVSRIRN